MVVMCDLSCYSIQLCLTSTVTLSCTITYCYITRFIMCDLSCFNVQLCLIYTVSYTIIPCCYIIVIIECDWSCYNTQLYQIYTVTLLNHTATSPYPHVSALVLQDQMVSDVYYRSILSCCLITIIMMSDSCCYGIQSPLICTVTTSWPAAASSWSLYLTYSANTLPPYPPQNVQGPVPSPGPEGPGQHGLQRQAVQQGGAAVPTGSGPYPSALCPLTWGAEGACGAAQQPDPAV